MARRKDSQWTDKQRHEWKARLSDSTRICKESDEDWGWILHLKDGFLHQDQLLENARRLVEYATEHSNVQRAMEALDGPRVHHPALYWAIWQTVEFDANNSYEEFQKRPATEKKLIKQIRAIASEQIELTDAIADDDWQYEAIAPSSEGDWVSAKVGAMRKIVTCLQKCADDLESINRDMLRPKAESVLTLSEKKRKNLHDLFVMSEAMLGRCQWHAIATLLNAISSIEGRPNPKEYCGDNMKKAEKYFRANHQHLLPQFNQSRLAVLYDFNRQRFLHRRKCGEISESIDVDTYLSEIMLRQIPADIRSKALQVEIPSSFPQSAVERIKEQLRCIEKSLQTI